MFMNFALFLFGYLFISVILPLPLGFKWKGLICLLTLLSAGRLAILRNLFPGYGGVETSKTLLALSSFFQGIVILFFLLAFIRDIIWLMGFIPSVFHKAEAGLKFRVFLRGIPFSLGMLLLCSILSGITLYEAAKVPDVKNHTIYLNKWPEALDGFRIAIISDLHISRFFDGPWTEKVVARVNELKPELILIPGDIVDGEVIIRRPETSPLSGLKSDYGTYMCVGNHEYISNLSKWLPEFRDLGIKNLYNSRETIKPRGADLVLAGVTDPAAYGRSLPGPDLPKALKGLGEDGGSIPPVILLDHRPAHAPENSKDPRVTLQFSGHTHGGLFPPLTFLVKRANKGFLRGWYEVGSMKMYVHPGTGLWSGVPMRLFNPSEITLLTINSKKEGMEP
jgi:predicted MPP superfamily phosphohydrolase